MHDLQGLQGINMIRHIKPIDFDFVDEIGTGSYPINYYEGIKSFKSKMTGYPDGCFVCEIDKNIVGYIISFPYIFGKPYPINRSYKKTEFPNCYYIHDLCIQKKYRGNGYANELVNEVLKIQSKPKVLVSVLKSEKFWEKFGFKIYNEIMYCKLPAFYMVN